MIIFRQPVLSKCYYINWLSFWTPQASMAYACLLQNLGLGESCSFYCKVRIHDTRTSGGYVFGDLLQVGNGRLETVLDHAQIATHLINFIQIGILVDSGGCTGTV